MKEVALNQSRKQKLFTEWTLDLLIYTVVLNVFVEHVDDFYIESFTLSLVVAFVLKFLLNMIIKFEHFVGESMKNSTKKTIKKLAPVVLVSILFFSKFLILEIIDWLFGHYVDLHNIFALIVMIIVMIATRRIITRIYVSLGD